MSNNLERKKSRKNKISKNTKSRMKKSRNLRCDSYHMRDWFTRDYIMKKIHKDTDIDWQTNIRVYFYWPRRMRVLQDIVERSILSFSNRVPSVFRRTSRAKTPLVFFFCSPQLNFTISCRKTNCSFLRLSMKVHTFRWDLKILLLNLLFHPNKTSITLQFI